jgi:hypothetical protein
VKRAFLWRFVHKKDAMICLYDGFYTKNKTSGFKPTLSACEERRSSGDGVVKQIATGFELAFPSLN